MSGERIKITLKAGHHRLASETPLNATSVFQGTRTSIAKKPYIFVIFRVCVVGGGGGPVPCLPSGSALVLPHDAMGCSKECDCGSSCFRMLKGDVLMKPTPSPDTQSNGDPRKQRDAVNWKKLNVKSTYVYKVHDNLFTLIALRVNSI